MTDQPYTATEIVEGWREDVIERGYWDRIDHVDDPRFIPAPRPRKAEKA